MNGVELSKRKSAQTLLGIGAIVLIATLVGLTTLLHQQSVTAERELHRHNVLHAQNEARRRRIAFQKHLRRAAFDAAHPEIVAQRKAAAAIKIAAVAQAQAEAREKQLVIVREATEKRVAASQQQYAIDHACETASAREKSSSKESGQAEYDDAVSGLHFADLCDDKNDQLVDRGYLLSMKAYAEHDLGTGDWKTDFNQANTLLVECQTTPGFYGERTGAACETQEGYNIRSSTNWEIAGEQ